MISIGTIGLIKGITTFDPGKGARLATYAARCVENEILMHFRSGRKSAQDVSLSDYIDTGTDGAPLALQDVVSEDTDLMEQVANQEAVGQLRRAVDTCLTEQERQVIQLRYALGTVSARSNTGVWIAITVMVFVAVFAATSGVVYLVLQKLLPPEEPKSHGPRNGGAGQRPQAPRPAAKPYAAPRPQQRPAPMEEDEDAYTAPRPQRPRPYGGEWVCPRDHSRNSGPYCALCGAPRPQPPKAGSAGAQRPAQPVRPQQPQSPAAYPQAQRPVPPAPQPTAATPRQHQQFDFDAAEQNTVSQPEPTPAYTGKFAKKASPAPAEQPAQEPEYDAELLAAIFREAEQGDGQQ